MPEGHRNDNIERKYLPTVVDMSRTYGFGAYYPKGKGLHSRFALMRDKVAGQAKSTAFYGRGDLLGFKVSKGWFEWRRMRTILSLLFLYHFMDKDAIFGFYPAEVHAAPQEVKSYLVIGSSETIGGGN